MNTNYDMVFDNFANFSRPVQIAFGCICGAIIIVSLISLIVSIILSISYVKFNKQQNRSGLTGEAAARQLLDANGLQNIKVAVTGSMTFGNSYSHYFKKVRIRRRTTHKESLTALAIGSQKAALAVLDKEKDPDMKKRIRLTPFIYLGPVACVPLLVIGCTLDLLIFHTNGIISAAFCTVGFLFYLLSVFFTFYTMKTEKKAQVKACEMLKANGMATDKELDDMKKLFRLYNIQYINDVILSLLELMYYVLQIIVMFSDNSTNMSKANA